MMANVPLTLKRTRPISPSKLSTFTTCPLRYLLETERPPKGGLSSNPIALRGTITHGLIEQSTGKPLPKAQELLEQFHALLAAAVTKKDANPLLKLAFERAGHAGVLSVPQVVSACSFVMKILKAHPQGLPAVGTGTAGQGSASPIGPERKFEDSSLDLGGYIDLTYADDVGNVHIVDYKTGSVLGEDGGPRAEYLLQMGAYGILVKKVLGPPKVFLELAGASSSWQGELDAGLEATALQLVNRLRCQLPRGEVVDADHLSKQGVHCQGCGFRPSCRAYLDCLQHAPTSDQRLSPKDVAGEIIEVSPMGALISLRLRTTKGHIVSIGGVPAHLLQDATPGTLVAAYGLGHFDDLTRAKFAANFFIFREDNPAASAFEATLKRVA
ncbi:MAG TPA: PD-(D/E)XK nuclease family protein [Noviherbaspirillum sp.]|uniref:PD-(D/E)XK nuclease family protein n=1 Tax=Noviherbaspirillum sp. TaxID=1926288 RepID=UPI002B49C948|nr:PD-(D/E)XK nuclease family protein [Noviherbaspirillum sp.]HJV86602.1 PD-(D/E)XK nuclease family protein [Noviherbaspirillum sp.]